MGCMAYFEIQQPVELIEYIGGPKQARARWLEEVVWATENRADPGWAPPHLVLLPAGKRKYELLSPSAWPVDGVGFEAFSHDPREG